MVIEVLDHGSKSCNGINHVRNCFDTVTTVDPVFPNNLIKLRVFLAPLRMEFFGRMHGSVGNGCWDVAKERVFAFCIRFNELHGVVHDDVVNVFPLFERLLFPVVNVSSGVVGVSNCLTFPAHEFIETVGEGIGVSFDMGMSESPLSIGAGSVAGGFKDFGKDGQFWVKRRDFVFSDIAAEINRSGLLACHENGARRAADSIAGIMGREL